MGRIGAVILAAGLSSRMGAFKPLLPLGDGTLAERTAACVLASGADPAVMVTGYRAAELEAALRGAGLIFVRNERFRDTQMLDSLRIGLAALPPDAERALFTPVDVPLVRPETVRLLLETPGDFVRPVFDGRGGHPAVLDRRLFPLLRDYRGPGGLRGALAAGGIVPVNVPVTDPAVLLDCDTPEAYRRLLAYEKNNR